MNSRGQAILPLLIIIIIVLSLGVTTLELAINEIVIDRYFHDEMTSFYTTEAALENGFLRILRNPSYLGEDLQINGASCRIEVSGGSPNVISAGCNNNRQVRKMRGEVSFVGGKMTITNIKEIE